MPTDTEHLEKLLDATGYGLLGTIGGLLRRTYYTPDGRIIKAIPQIRGYVKRDKDGKVIESGERDANLDGGWLSQMPQVKKLFCKTCDRWHDTLKEVAECARKQSRMIKREEMKARKEIAVESVKKDVQIDALTKRVESLAKLVESLSAKAS